MARKAANTKTFSDILIELAKKELPEWQQVVAARRLYLANNEENIKQAVEAGYNYALIAEAATADLLKKDLPLTYTVKNEEGEEETLETKIWPWEINKICDPEA